MQLTQALKNYGLTDNQAKIYTSLLRLLEAPVYQIAKQSQVPRTTAYTCLEDLKNQGLVLCFHKNNVLYYTPESSKKLLEILETKKEIINSVIPQIDALISSSPIKPVIKLYAGKEGIKTVRQDILVTLAREKDKTLRAIANYGLYEIVPKFFPDWLKRRVELNIHSQLILPLTARAQKEFSSENNQKYLRQVKFLPASFEYECSVNIYANKLAFFSLKKNQITSVIMESPPVTQMFKQFFLFNWQILSDNTPA